MKSSKYLGFFAGTVAALVFLSIRAKATESTDSWGELGYTNPGPVVEEIPETISEDAPTLSLAEAPSPTNSSVAIEDSELDKPMAVKITKSSRDTTVVAEDLPLEEAPKKKKMTDISTVENTYGVMTEEKQKISVYVAPFGGVASVVGNDTSDTTPKGAMGITAGALISSNMLIFGTYTYSLQNFSNPRRNASNGIALASADLFEMKQNSFEGGVRLYVLGRESRVRPFLSGGMGISKGTLNYTAQNQQVLAQYSPIYANEFTISQVNGFGEVGAEIAITKQIVASASFKLRGVLSSSTSGGDSANAGNYDPSKLDVGNSLSRSTSFVMGAGLGVYF